MHALQRLQRALLAHELQRLAALEWEACFHKVLFPLLAKLLPFDVLPSAFDPRKRAAAKEAAKKERDAASRKRRAGRGRD